MKIFTFLVLLIAALLSEASVRSAAAKTLVYCSEGSPQLFNTQLTTSITTTDATLPVYDTLVAFKPGTLDLAPALAERWTVSEDGRVYRFFLRHGVRFHTTASFTPTRDFTAADVLFSLNRQLRPDHPYHKVSGGAYNAFRGLGLHELIDAIEARGDYEVEIRLKRPEAPFLADLSMPLGIIQSAEYAGWLLARGTPERLDLEPLGTGPYRLVSYDRDVSLRYAAFAEHWAGRPALDGLVFLITPSAAVRLNRVRAGECHVMALPDPAEIDRLRQDPALVVQQANGLNIGFLALNTAAKPFNDQRVRRAVNLAIDKQALIEAVFQGSGQAAKNLIPPGLWSYNDEIADLPYDPGQARDLIAQAGYTDGLDISLLYMPVARAYMPNARRAGEMIQTDLARIGIRAQLATEDWKTYFERVRRGGDHAAIAGWVADNGDPDDFFFLLLGCDKGAPNFNNVSLWCDDQVNALFLQAKATLDRDQRAALYREAQRRIQEKAPMVPLAHSVVFMVLRREVTGYRMSPFGRQDFRGVSLSE